MTGSLTTESLLTVGASLGVVGLEIPANWSEAATATLAEAMSAFPGLLVAVGIDGFEESPTIALASRTIGLQELLDIASALEAR